MPCPRFDYRGKIVYIAICLRRMMAAIVDPAAIDDRCCIEKQQQVSLVMACDVRCMIATVWSRPPSGVIAAPAACARSFVASWQVAGGCCCLDTLEHACIGACAGWLASRKPWFHSESYILSDQGLLWQQALGAGGGLVGAAVRGPVQAHEPGPEEGRRPAAPQAEPCAAGAPVSPRSLTQRAPLTSALLC